MNNWREVKLGDVLEITSSKRIFMSEYVSYGIPFYRGKEIIECSNGNNISTELFISEEKFSEIKNKNGVPLNDDILLTSVGTLGIPYKVKQGDKFYFKDGNITWFRNYSDKINPDFLYKWLKSDIAKNCFDKITIGSTQKALTIASLKTIKLNLPPLEEQVEIAGVLGALDDKIEANCKQNETLEAMAQAIFKSWFIDFEPFAGTMPNDWKEKDLGDICKIVYGKGLPTINLLDKGYPVFGGNGQIGFYSKYIYEEPQVIISCRGAASGKVMHSLKESFITNNSLVCEIKNKNELNRFYLERILKLIDMTRFTTGSAQPQITIENISSVSVLIPAAKIMNDFGKILETIDAKITFNDECSNNLAQIRDSLLPRLMSGKIRIPLNKKD